MSENMVIDEYLDAMDDVLLKAHVVPFSGKKSVTDVETLKDLIDNIRMNMPVEIKQAKKIVQERKAIIDEANKQAEEIITRAENRANALVANNEITKAAEAKAADIEKQAVIKARAVKNAADEYLAETLAKTEEVLSASLTNVRRIKSTIKSPKPAPNPNIPVQR